MSRTQNKPIDPNFNRSATALRERGFVPLPRLWVKREAIAKIHEIAYQYREEVQAIRQEVNGGPLIPKDPAADKDAAWEAYEKARKA